MSIDLYQMVKPFELLSHKKSISDRVSSTSKSPRFSKMANLICNHPRFTNLIQSVKTIWVICLDLLNSFKHSVPCYFVTLKMAWKNDLFLLFEMYWTCGTSFCWPTIIHNPFVLVLRQSTSECNDFFRARLKVWLMATQWWSNVDGSPNMATKMGNHQLAWKIWINNFYSRKKTIMRWTTFSISYSTFWEYFSNRELNATCCPDDIQHLVKSFWWKNWLNRWKNLSYCCVWIQTYFQTFSNLLFHWHYD